MGIKNLIVINIRGSINAKARVKRTLEQLHIPRRYRATIIADTDIYQGMLQTVKDHVSWFSLDKATLTEILKKRAKRKGGYPLTIDDLKKSQYKSFINLADDLQKGKTTLAKLGFVRQYFALAPPKGGFKKSIRRSYRQGGILAKNPDLPKLILKML